MEIYYHTFLTKFREINFFANALTKYVQESQKKENSLISRKKRLQIEEYNPSFFYITDFTKKFK